MIEFGGKDGDVVSGVAVEHGEASNRIVVMMAGRPAGEIMAPKEHTFEIVRRLLSPGPSEK